MSKERVETSLEGCTMIIGIPLRTLNKKTAFKFPDRCVNCSQPKAELLGLSLDLGTQAKIANLQMQVPMCKACADKERRVAMVTLIPFLVAGLLIGIAVLVPVALVAPEGNTIRTLTFPLVLGAFAGLIAGILGGSLVEFVVKMLATPFYGKLLLQRPLTAVSLFSARDDLIGLSARLSSTDQTLQLIFENDEIAREFAQLNPQETP